MLWSRALDGPYQATCYIELHRSCKAIHPEECPRITSIVRKVQLSLRWYLSAQKRLCVPHSLWEVSRVWVKRFPHATKRPREKKTVTEGKKQGLSLQISVITCAPSGNNPICISMIENRRVFAMFELRFLSRNKWPFSYKWESIKRLRRFARLAKHIPNSQLKSCLLIPRCDIDKSSFAQYPQKHVSLELFHAFSIRPSRSSRRYEIDRFPGDGFYSIIVHHL